MEPAAAERLKTGDESQDAAAAAAASSSPILANMVLDVMNNGRRSDGDDKPAAKYSVESDANALLEAGILPKDKDSVEYDRLMRAFKFIGDSAIQEKCDEAAEATFREDGIVLNAFQYLDVATLIQKKPVCKKWQSLCTRTIDEKCSSDGKTKKAFQTNQELKDAVAKYSPPKKHQRWRNAIDDDKPCTPVNAEEIASTYGYPIGKWDVSSMRDFSYVFDARARFNESIASWDVSNATSMGGMFYDAHLFDRDLSLWDVSGVKNMKHLFSSARSFNQDISSWDVSNVLDMQCMFRGAHLFNQDISSWVVSNVTNMFRMFDCACRFDQDLSNWDVSNVADMRAMFRGASSFDHDISAWDVSNVLNFESMFCDCKFDARQLRWFSVNRMMLE